MGFILVLPKIIHKMPKILIVEDQVLIANHIKNILNDNGFFNIEMAFKINQAVEKLNLFDPDIVLLDINVEGKDTGIKWAEEHVKKAKIIFITGQTELETLQKALSINPISYLSKPVKSIDLLAAVTLVTINLKPTYVVVKDGYKDIKVKFEDIFYIKSDKNYIDIHILNKKISIRCSLDDFMEKLDLKMFCKVHRSYIVNISKITEKKTSSVVINSFEIPVSRNLNLNL